VRRLCCVFGGLGEVPHEVGDNKKSQDGLEIPPEGCGVITAWGSKALKVTLRTKRYPNPG